MSEVPALVYKAISTESLEARARARQVEVQTFHDAVDVLSAELGGREVTGISFFAGGFAPNGYRMNDANDLLPGWRRDGSSMRAVPAKRTPEGKEWTERLSQVRLADHDMPGFPARMRCDGFALYPQVEAVGDDYFMTISMQPYDQYLEQIDHELWASAKLSDYFLAREAAEAEKETP